MTHQIAIVAADDSARHFGGDPYELALAAGGGMLRVQPVAGGPLRRVDVGRWLQPADAVDRALIERAGASVLDIGCGPGRIVRASIASGRIALGIDVSRGAVRIGTSAGLPILLRSVFGAVPREGEWEAVILADGNIGIGGDPVQLLERCAHLLAPEGALLVETDADPVTERRFVARMRDASGRTGPEFPWAELGAVPLRAAADEVGLRVVEHWSIAGRAFSLLRRRSGPHPTTRG